MFQILQKKQLNLGRWIPEATEQNLIKFILQSTFSALGDKTFPGKRFYQPLIFETQTGSEPNTVQFQTKKKKKKRKKEKKIIIIIIMF